MSALLSDIADERVDLNQAHAMCKVGNTLLRVVEMQHVYNDKHGADADLVLAESHTVTQQLQAPKEGK